jgi:hypothetical protein
MFGNYVLQHGQAGGIYDRSVHFVYFLKKENVKHYRNVAGIWVVSECGEQI